LRVLIAYGASVNLSLDIGVETVGKGRILVAEDFPAAAFMVEQMLEELGFEVDIVANGRDAVNKASNTRYAAILMDVEMPVMDGVDATVLIRKLEQKTGFEPNPIIGMTGHTSQGVRVLCQRAGMDNFLIKPFSIEDLDAVLAKVVVS
jgi:CheY-like chemotaxis protein